MKIKRENHLFYLISQDMSLIIEERNGYLFLKHLGRKIENYNFSNTINEIDHSFSPNPTLHDRTFSLDVQRNLIGQFGRGDFREPSLRIQFDNNEITDFRYKDYKIFTGTSDIKGLPSPYSSDDKAQTLKLILEDKVAELSLHIFFTVYENQNTITTYQEIVNHSCDKIIIHKLHSVMLDLPAKNYDVISFQGGYAKEKTVRRYQVKQGLFEVSSRRGASSHSQTPALILADSSATDYSGEAIAMQLMYSGNFQSYVQMSQLNEVRMGIGINEENFAWELDSQDRFAVPAAVISYSSEGLNRLTQESHNFILEHIMPEESIKMERPILINNWEATYFDFDNNKLLKLADEAEELGIELFVLDDGWFGNRSDDKRALGDWQVNEQKIGGTLASLIEKIHKKGMKFGLWIEPETISADSDLYRKHPEWVIKLKGREHTFSRSQLVLDYSNPAVVEYMTVTIDNILSNHKIDYIKWDFNRNLTDIGNGINYIETMMQSHKFMLGVYKLAEYLSSKHKNILFESCSGGGGRNDLGMLRYFPQSWSSDNTDAIERLMIQYGTSYLIPPIVMGAHVSTVPNHQMNRNTPIETRANVAMMGNFGYELDLNQLNISEKALISEQVKQYKKLRPLIQFGSLYRLINPDNHSNETAVQYNYQDQTVLFYIRILSKIEEIETTVKLKALEEGAFYKIAGTDKVYSGAELMYAGLTMDMPRGDFLSKLIHLQKI